MSFIENFFFSLAGPSYIILWLTVGLSLSQQKKLIDIIAEILVYFYAILFLGLRSKESGTDTIAYVNSFNDLKMRGYFPIEWELIYDIFGFLVSWVVEWQGFIILNVVIQLLLISILGRMISIKNISILLLAYITLLPGFDMLTNGLRQGLSSALGLLIFILWVNGVFRKKLFFLPLLLMLHKSILIHFPFYFIEKLASKIGAKKVVNALILSFTGLVIIWHLIDFRGALAGITSLLALDLSTSSLSVGEKFNVYLQNEQYMMVGIYKYYFLFISLFFLFVIWRHVRKNYGVMPYFIEKFCLFVCFLSIPYALIWISPFSYRFMYVFFLPGLLLVVLLLATYKRAFTTGFWLMLLIMAVFTYGSNTFYNFDY